MKRKLIVALASIVFIYSNSQAQTSTTKVVRPINTAVPFLLISPDSRAAGMGDAGVASSPDANSQYWNVAKLAFIDKSMGSSLSYTPWLRDLINDMGLINASIYKKVGSNQGLGLSMTYFDQGIIEFTTGTGQPNGTFSSREFNIAGGYSRKLSRDFSMGVNLRFIHSNLVGTYVVNNSTTKAANNAAMDVAFYYTNDQASDRNQDRGIKYSAGAVISNIGGKLNYGSGEFFVPTNLKLGGGIGLKLDDHNNLNFILDINKLLVPTPPLRDSNGQIIKGKDPNKTGVFDGIFGSFGDAPDGFSEEMKEFTGSLGVEYLYNNIFAARAGYFAESKMKGAQQYLTTGLGFRVADKYQVDLAYLIPTVQGSGLANTWRISLIFDMNSRNASAELDADGESSDK